MSPETTRVPKPTIEEIKIAANARIKLKLIGEAGTVLKWMVAGFMLWVAGHYFAGQVTVIYGSLITNFTVTLKEKLQWGVTIGALVWGGINWWLKKRMIKQHAKQLHNYEKLIHPKRRSSNLTEYGNSHPEV